MSPPTPRILETKLNPPAATATQVPRTAIREEIAAATVKLVLVRAPAGFGKTTAMAQIRERMEAQGIATAWLTLDRADNDVSRFLDCLAEAAQRLGVEEPRANGPFDAVAALAAHDAPFTLFLDDFEVVQEPAVLGLVREIVEHLPRRGQLVIGSRGLPDLGLGRLRARGQLIEIDTDRLRFSLEETSAFFGLRMAHAKQALQTLPAELLSQLHRKTEGWVAAIWLASMALERHGTETGFVERFSGSDRAVADYLAEDVLAHQPPDIRDFLLRTSILRQLDASVCQALCPRADCAAILERLAASNLFLTPVSGDGADSAWRYHSLFADFLRARLAHEQPGETARLHLSAAGWYESHDRPVPAIDHAIEGGDHPYALALLDSYAAQFLEQGRMRMLARWFSAIPEHQLREHPFLQPIALWATCFTHGPWEAMRMLEQSGCLDSPIAEVRASAHTLVPLLLAMQDRHDEAYEIGRQSLARLPTGLPFADSVLLNAMAHILAVRGDQHEARRMLEAARERGSSTFNRMYTESLAGLFDLHEGRLRQATARLRMAVDSTHAVSYNHSHGNAWAGVLYAGAVYETNQLVQAEHLLNVYLPLARDVGLPDHMILSHVMRSRLAFHAGDIDAAFQALTELEYLGHHRQLPRVVAGAKLERSRMLLLQRRPRPVGPREAPAPAGARPRLHGAGAGALGHRVRRRARRAGRARRRAAHRAGIGAQPPRAQAAGAARAGAAGRGRHGRRRAGDRDRAAGREPGRLRAADPRRRPGRRHAGAPLRALGAGCPRRARRPDPGGLPAAPAAARRPDAGGRAGIARHRRRRDERAAHAQGNPRAAAAGRGIFEQRDGGKTVRLRQHGAHAPAQHQHETRREEPHAGGGHRAPAGRDPVAGPPAVLQILRIPVIPPPSRRP